MPRNITAHAGGHVARVIARKVRKERLSALRDALVEGEQSGASTSFDVEEFVSRKRQRRRRAKAAL